MQGAIERVVAMALERFGVGELQINQFGNVFWRRPEGTQVPLGYTILDAEHWLKTLSTPSLPSPAGDEEEG
jgi:hypothetical protein